MHSSHRPAAAGAPLAADAAERLARRRASAKLGWLVHAAVYACVNLGLAALSVSQGRTWALFPAFGWGLGLLAHGLAVALPGRAGIYGYLLARERAALRRQP